MPTVKLLSESDLRRCVQLDLDTVDCIENCFRILATQKVIMPPIMRMDIAEHNGEVDVKTAYLPGLDNFAIKMSPGFFDNPSMGLPSTGGMMVLFSSRTGVLEAVLMDNGYLTVVRTAAAGAVAAKTLSRPDSQHVGIIGAGDQAKQQLHALTLVRDIRSAKIWARNLAKAKDFAERVGTDLDIDIKVVEAPSQVCKETDIILTTTPSHTPLLQLADLQPGQHITAMGSDAEEKMDSHRISWRVLRIFAIGFLRSPLWANCIMHSSQKPFPLTGYSQNSAR